MAPQKTTVTPSESGLSNSAAVIVLSPSRAHQWFGALSAVTVVLSCALWYLAFSKLGVSLEALPWYITVGVIGVFCSRVATRKFLTTQTVSAALPKSSRESLSLLETWAITYLAASIGLYLLVAFVSIATPEKSQRITRFIDIQLVSNADFADRHSPLPGTQEMPNLHKRQSDQITRQGSFASQKPASKTAPSKQEAPTNNSHQRKAQTKPTPAAKAQVEKIPAMVIVQPQKQGEGAVAALQKMDASDMMLVKPAAPSAPSQTRAKQQTVGRNQPKVPYMEEVQPPELVEMVENEGTTNSANLFAEGGSSSGGKGASNDLTAYLKALHKHIKDLWSPPRGLSHKAIILFRIRRDGKLAFVKLVQASGDQATDAAAIKAITGSVTGIALPASYSLPYLDVQYTFNYAADDLKEVD